MKKILTLLPIAILTSLFFACSSIELDEDDIFEVYGNMLPDDFVLAEFSEINPDIAVSQILDTIKNLNKDFKGTEKQKSEFALEFAQGDGRRIAIDYLKWDSVKVEEMTGVVETEAAKGLMPSVNNAREEVMWLKYTIFSEQSELAILKEFMENSNKKDSKFKVDSILITRSYVQYGKKNGRAYRYCSDDELDNPKKEVIAEDADYRDKSFCYNKDDKTVREIEEDL